jgi:hypothetical protein
MINGTFTAGAHGVFLNPFEVDLELFAYDAGAIGHVTNITRNTGDTGAGLGALTAGYRVQSKGTYAVDVGFSATGLFKVILDATAATLTTAKAAIALCSGFRIYGNASSSDGRKATSYGTDWIERLATGWNIVFNNVAALLISDTAVTFLKPPVTPTVTVSALPAAAAGNKGMEYYVSDASATTLRSVVAGGGSNFVKVFSTGTQWLIGH